MWVYSRATSGVADSKRREESLRRERDQVQGAFDRLVDAANQYSEIDSVLAGIVRKEDIKLRQELRKIR